MDYCEEYTLLNDESNLYKNISYNELIDMFNNLETGFVFIGSPKCKNCQAIIDRLNTLAKENNLNVIYNYDPKYINVFNEEEDLRDCLNLDSKLEYYKLIEKIGLKNDELVENTLMPKMHIPFFFSIKNGICVGYYQVELLMDDYLHKENETDNLNNEFDENINNLIRML